MLGEGWSDVILTLGSGWGGNGSVRKRLDV